MCLAQTDTEAMSSLVVLDRPSLGAGRQSMQAAEKGEREQGSKGEKGDAQGQVEQP